MNLTLCMISQEKYVLPDNTFHCKLDITDDMNFVYSPRSDHILVRETNT